MQRGHRDQPLDLGEHGVVDDRRRGEELPAVHDPVPDRGQLRGVEPQPVLRELFSDRLQGRVVVGDRRGPLPGLPAAGEGRVLEPGGLLADALDESQGRSRLLSRMSSSWYFTDEEPELRTRTRVALTGRLPSR